jgi:hypothetical protein
MSETQDRWQLQKDEHGYPTALLDTEGMKHPELANKITCSNPEMYHWVQRVLNGQHSTDEALDKWAAHYEKDHEEMRFLLEHAFRDLGGWMMRSSNPADCSHPKLHHYLEKVRELLDRPRPLVVTNLREEDYHQLRVSRLFAMLRLSYLSNKEMQKQPLSETEKGDRELSNKHWEWANSFVPIYSTVEDI